MELDKRIKTITDIKSVTDGCHDWELMNKKGYFANRIVNFTDLSTCAYGEYAEYREHDQCFLCEDNKTYYSYFLPEDVLEPIEKKYRPYKNPQEMFDDLGCYIGDIIHLRTKTKEEHHMMVVGYADNTVTLGNDMFNFNQLFAEFELRSRGEWQPFGVEE